MKHLRVKIALLLVTVICLAWLTLTRLAFPTYSTWSGSDSKIMHRSYQRVTSHEAWEKLWHQHTDEKYASGWLYSADDSPRINFKTCMVVAVFHGSSFNSNGIELHSTIQERNFLKVRFTNRHFQIAGLEGGAKRVTPYGIFVLPRSDQQIIVEEDVHLMIGDVPLWKERARLR